MQESVGDDGHQAAAVVDACIHAFPQVIMPSSVVWWQFPLCL